MTTLGRVTELRRFPVKSMAGECLDTADLQWTGFAGDRQFAFVRSDDTSHFPWMTGRQLSAMVLYRAAYDGPVLRTAAVRVTAPDGVACAVTDPALAHALAERVGEAMHLMRMERGCFDAMPVSLLTTGGLAAIERAHGAGLDPLRFRANLLVDGPADAREWMGRVLAIGRVRVRVDWAIPRCAMITIDPATAQREPGIQRTVAQFFANEAGVYATVVTPGPVSVGDIVTFAD